MYNVNIIYHFVPDPGKMTQMVNLLKLWLNKKILKIEKRNNYQLLSVYQRIYLESFKFFYPLVMIGELLKP